MNIPSLYPEKQKGMSINNQVFWKWIFNAILHSMILFWQPIKTYEYGMVLENGKSGDYLGLGNTVYLCAILTVCLKAGMRTMAWNWIIHLSVWGSMALGFNISHLPVSTGLPIRFRRHYVYDWNASDLGIVLDMLKQCRSWCTHTKNNYAFSLFACFVVGISKFVNVSIHRFLIQCSYITMNLVGVNTEQRLVLSYS